MRPNTRSSGIFSTKRSSAVSVSMLTRMLVPKPKNAFQSPLRPQGWFECRRLSHDFPLCLKPSFARVGRARERRQHCFRIRYPAEDAALRLDHLQAHLVEFREIGGAAVAEHDAAVAAVVGLAHGSVDADLGGDAADDEIVDAVVAQRQPEIGFAEGALAGLVDHRLALGRIELGNDVVTRFAAHEDAAHGALVADALGRRAALDLGGRRIGQIRAVALAGVNHQHAGRARGLEHGLARLHGTLAAM